MANTIREQIILAIITRLGNVRTANGYNTECGQNVLRVRKNLDPDELPAIVVWPQQEEAAREYGRCVCEMPVRIEGLMEFGATNPSVVTEQILGDLVVAMKGADPCGGLADNVEYSQGGTDDYPEEGEKTAGCAALFSIRYETRIGDPYTQ